MIEQNEIMRDHRWENVYASKAPFEHEHAEKVDGCYRCGWIVLRIDVEYKNKPYWYRQVLDQDDIRDLRSDFDVWRWIWNEMVQLVDREMKGVK